MASRKGSSAEATATDFDPLYEWLNEGANYVLRLNLPGFKQEDLTAHVDPAGWLTVSGQRPADGGAGSFRLHKVFQMPPTSYLDGITGRFDGTVLTFTMPKLPTSAVAEPETKEEETDDDVAGKPMDQKAKVGAERRIEAARARLVGRQREEEQPKAEATTTPSEKAVKREREDQDDKAKAEHRAKIGRDAERRIDAARATLAGRQREEEQPKAEATTTPSEKAVRREREDQDDKAKAEQKAKIGREAERRIEVARARLSEEEGESDRERIGHWKELAAEEGFNWAEAIGKNKEVIATAVAVLTLGAFISHNLIATVIAVFTLGVFFSHKLFSRN